LSFGTSLRLSLQRPRAAPWRRVVLKVHLGLALLLAVYLAVISVSGSAVVFRREFNVWLTPRAVPQPGVERMSEETLAVRVAEVYPEHTVALVRVYQRPASRAAYARLERGGVTLERMFDPYSGADLGDPFPLSLKTVEWLVDLHDNLLAGDTGRTVNGVGALLFLTLAITGAVVWWPGTSRVGHALVPGKPAKSARFARRLHNAFGIWMLALILVWAVTAVYFSFPDPFEWTIDYFDNDLTDDRRPGDWLVKALVDVHFGRSWGMTGKLVWVVFGLVPAALFITGCITWWSRVVRRRAAAAVEPPAALAEDGARN
jgi:uncharacterized iron-regulated membrane protein